MMILENGWAYNTVKDFDYTIFKQYNTVTRRKKGKLSINYVDVVAAFDIETTAIDEDHSIMYIWQICIDGTIVIGRTWGEFRYFLDKTRKALSGRTLVLYVHNLSFEFQFLRGILDFDSDNVFAVERRKILFAAWYCFEFRCSYLLSNMSLRLLLKKTGIKELKVEGFDYTVKRWPWSSLSDHDLLYAITDVVGLVKAIKKLMEMREDNIATIPFTSTGYVKRECKKRMKAYPKIALDGMKINIEEWRILREAFRGGDTHANRHYAGEILNDVISYDRSSSYPDVIVNCKFPMSKFDYKKRASADDLKRLIQNGKACVFRCAITNLRLIDEAEGCPYISRDKCRVCKNYVNDNGRLLNAEYIETSMTDVDLRIVLDMYEFDDIAFYDIYFARYDKLPAPIIEMCNDYYKKKTIMKGVPEQRPFYEKIKNEFNAIYGMMAQNPVKRRIIVDDDYHYSFEKTDEEILSEYNQSAFLLYQWGVWVTAWARYRLHEAIKIAGRDFVYCDTDSVKMFRGNEYKFSEYNKKRIADSENNGAVAADIKGNNHYMGVYELDGEYNEFITLGAKKYAYTDDEGLHVTISGVSKEEGAKELSSITNFRTGFTFSKAGGKEARYYDGGPYYINIDGHNIRVTKSVTIVDSSYTLGITGEYADIIKRCKYLFEMIENKY